MSAKSLSTAPLARAQELHIFLEALPSKVRLSTNQQKALDQDIEALDELISELSAALSKDDWRRVWEMVKNVTRSFGGYVGDEWGVELNRLTDALWKATFDAYSDAMK